MIMVSFFRDITPRLPLTQKNDWPTKCPICHQMVKTNMETKAEKNAEIQTVCPPNVRSEPTSMIRIYSGVPVRT